MEARSGIRKDRESPKEPSAARHHITGERKPRKRHRGISNPSSGCGGRAPSVKQAPWVTTHRPFRAGHAQAPAADPYPSIIDIVCGLKEEVLDENSRRW